MGVLGEAARTLGGDIDAAEASWRDELAAAQAEIVRLQAELDACRNPVAVKAITRGIFTRQSLPLGGTPVRVGTVPVNWSALEPVRGAVDLAPILAILNDAEARGLDGVRIRPMLGRFAPGWAKELGNGPIPFQVTEGGNTATGTIPDIWDAEFQAAAADLCTALSALDDDPRLLLIFASAGMTWYAEPFIRSIGENREALETAGYTAAKDRPVQKWQLDIMGGFTRTPVGLAYNPWQHISDAGVIVNDIGYMAEVMDHHAATFGERCVLQNNSIRSSYIASPPPMYQAFRDRPGSVHQFQTAAAIRVGDEEATIRWAHDYLGANGVEHAGTLSDATYAELDTLLRN